MFNRHIGIFFCLDYIEKSNQRKIVSFKWNGIISDNL